MASPNPKDLIDYNPETGIFTWKIRKSMKTRVGSRAGSETANGYRQIMIDGKNYLEHRLAWYLVKGYWPIEVDHIDHNTFNNKFDNLRECTRQENARYRNGNGIHQDRRTGRWIAQITVSGKGRHLGSFSTKEKAAEARATAAKEVYGDFYLEPKR